MSRVAALSRPVPAAGHPDVQRPRGGRAVTAGLALFGGALVALVLWLAHTALIDDAYITLSYAQNLAAHGHWGLTPQQPSNTATSPGNVLLIAGATTVLRVLGGIHPVLGLGAVSVGCGLVLGWGLARVVRHLDLPWVAAVLGVALLVLNPVTLSAIGLEVLPVAAVLVALLAVALAGRPVAFGLVAGAAVLIRLDLAVFVVLVALATGAVRRRLYLALPSAVLVGLGWYAWSWWHFGSAVPDTYVIKTLQRSFGGVTFADGPAALYQSVPAVVVLGFLPAALGALALAGWLVAVLAYRSPRLRRMAPAAALGLGGLAYYGLYSLLGVPPYHWYYAPTLSALTVFLTVAVGGLLGRREGWRRWLRAAPAALAATALLGFTVGLVATAGAPWERTFIFGNWASRADYSRVGTELAQRVGDSRVRVLGEVGTLAYFCGCALVNDFSDRGLVVPLVEQRIAEAGPLTRRLLELNYSHLDRTRTARPVRYELRFVDGPGSGPDTWQVYAPGRGYSRLVLVPAPSAS